jgi:hypothetical protein
LENSKDFKYYLGRIVECIAGTKAKKIYDAIKICGGCFFFFAKSQNNYGGKNKKTTSLKVLHSTS